MDQAELDRPLGESAELDRLGVTEIVAVCGNEYIVNMSWMHYRALPGSDDELFANLCAALDFLPLGSQWVML